MRVWSYTMRLAAIAIVAWPLCDAVQAQRGDRSGDGRGSQSGGDRGGSARSGGGGGGQRSLSNQRSGGQNQRSGGQRSGGQGGGGNRGLSRGPSGSPSREFSQGQVPGGGNRSQQAIRPNQGQFPQGQVPRNQAQQGQGQRRDSFYRGPDGRPNQELNRSREFDPTRQAERRNEFERQQQTLQQQRNDARNREWSDRDRERFTDGQNRDRDRDRNRDTWNRDDRDRNRDRGDWDRVGRGRDDWRWRSDDIRRDWWRSYGRGNVPFRSGWWDNYYAAGWPVYSPYRYSRWRDRPYYWWGYTPATALTDWIVFGWDRPRYWAYGPGRDVYYQDNYVYFNNQRFKPANEYYDYLRNLARSVPQISAEQAEQIDWKPLGVFALSRGNETQAQRSMQIAVSRDGVLTGTYYNQQDGHVHPITGMVEDESQRAAWAFADGEHPGVVFESSLLNLTQPETTIMVHFGPAASQAEVWTAARLEQPEDSATSTQPQPGVAVP